MRDPAVGRQQQLQQEDHRRQQGQIRRAAVAGKKETICVILLVSFVISRACLVIATPRVCYPEVLYIVGRTYVGYMVSEQLLSCSSVYRGDCTVNGGPKASSLSPAAVRRTMQIAHEPFMPPFGAENAEGALRS